jgi:hypothetical protein
MHGLQKKRTEMKKKIIWMTVAVAFFAGHQILE